MRYITQKKKRDETMDTQNIPTTSAFLFSAVLTMAGCQLGEWSTASDTQHDTAGLSSSDSGSGVTTSDQPTSTSSNSNETDASATSGSTEGGETTNSTNSGEICEDSDARACFACNAMGSPQRLFGLTWNYAGFPGSTLGMEELRCIVPETGESELIGAIPGMDWLPVGSNAHDPQQKVLYALAFADSDNIMRLFSINTMTGKMLNNPPVEGQFHWDGGLYIRSDGKLVGMTWNTIKGQAELRALNQADGNSALIAEVPSISSFYWALFTYDRTSDHIYTIGSTKIDQPKAHLFVIDAVSGQLLSDAAFAEEHAWSGIYLTGDGQLVGLDAYYDVERLYKIQVETAATTLIVEIPEFKKTQFSASVYDATTDTILIVDGDSHLFKIDTSTGQIFSSPKLATPFPDSNYNWSGGIHVR